MCKSGKDEKDLLVMAEALLSDGGSMKGEGIRGRSKTGKIGIRMKEPRVFFNSSFIYTRKCLISIYL